MLQAYWYITKMRLITSLTYRFEVFASVGTNLILMLASVFLWKAAYGNGTEQVQALTLQDLTTYTILSIMLASVFVCDVQDTIYSKIREGQIVTDFYRPIPLLACYLADDIGGMLSSMVNKVIPLFIFAALFFGVPWPASPLSFLLFIPSCLLSYAILWLLSALIGLIAFWVMELGNMGMVKDSIVRVLSGSIVPLWFFPESIQTISKFLPFQYTYQTPLGIYIGNIGVREGLMAMGIQLIWVVLLYVLLAAGWRRSKSKTLIQGG
ncbi:ABC transporter permease [Paenibacillus pinihumi]|uniref:ABC transporter permease n=1 Tax=Paenibacillus pinihumi TaxID=669462 RepID=UPI000420A823|nr:ABC-2 family transporter protein [Paenibacillus pinihumi]